MSLGPTCLGMAFLLLCTGCPTSPPPASPAATTKAPRIALVLGGGGARGFAHVGVIRALEQEKIPVHLIVGTSVGSLIGALYAHKANSMDLEWTAFSLEQEDFLDYALLSISMNPIKDITDMASTRMGLAKGERLEAFVKKNVPVNDIEKLKIPFAAVATDLNRGTRVVLDRGPLARAVRASCALPFIFQPVEHQGRLLVDGGAIDNLPVAVARGKRADIVIAVDISQNVANFNITNLVDIGFQAMDIMANENMRQRRHDADVLISPEVGSVAMMDFTQKKRLMQAGMDAGRKSMPAIRSAIANWKAKQDKVATAVR
jgi:NTE family protein